MALTAAIAQLSSSPSVVDNLARGRELAARAADAGADLVLFPELSLTGYDLDRLAAASSWFAPTDARLDDLRALSRAAGLTIVLGAPVSDGDGRVLASLVLQPSGSVVVAAKTYLHGDEVAYFSAGTGPTVVDVAGERVALAICFDTAFPAHAADAAAAGASVYAASVVYVEGEEGKLGDRMRARAGDHGMVALAANAGGPGSVGESGAWATDGAVLAAAKGPGDQLLVVAW
ncbi:carbon-nitrogen hydrolase family protein [Cellulomonas sp.]|uniref:carbon-nitrogen hydrolase family protein n=1 Tax=Cellulomonas sp. TaxID=40001 RepID=UPI001B1F7B19|nr:carbon-nitrogen hydrolase family protein [Cellulomonas sp.]MBO9554331.1 carbon-nitrogen hydrolase family protein [Cellulomonas sp.]